MISQADGGGIPGSASGFAELRYADTPALVAAQRAQREQTLATLEFIRGDRWLGPARPTVNPPRWEIGHVGWFQERWCLRAAHDDSVFASPVGGRQWDAPVCPSSLPNADYLFDSGAIAHDQRWTLPLPEPARLRDWLAQVNERACAALAGKAGGTSRYFAQLVLFHEAMHQEAFQYSWQTLGYERPVTLAAPAHTGPLHWLALPEGLTEIGARADGGFVFDNEQWATDADLCAGTIANRVVSVGEFAQFVRDCGYLDERLWPASYFAGLRRQGRTAPVYWRNDSDDLQVRRFDRWVVPHPDEPVCHVDAFEAAAWCAWADATLPTEAQWTHAARYAVGFQWGDVWEWTSCAFAPLQGFQPGPYREYSQPWFGAHRVLKGASFATPEALRDVRFRNFFLPERNDMFCGFRAARSRKRGVH